MEREVKVALNNYEDIRQRLLALGRHIGSEEQLDVYLTSECLPKGSAIRVRVGSESGARITYKGPLVEDVVKTREEIEIKVESFESALKLLLLTGFKELIRVKKRRETYIIKGLKLELDLVEGLGGFIEIEVKDDEELLKAKNVILSLGAPWAPIKEGYAELLAKRLGKGEQKL